LSKTPEAPQRIRPEIPLELEQIILRCLQKRPEGRYGSGDEVHTALRSCHHTLSARTGNIPWPRPAAIAVLLAVALTAGALGFDGRSWLARTLGDAVAVPEISRLVQESSLAALACFAARYAATSLS
jgi:serine/threonine-protein kinase